MASSSACARREGALSSPVVAGRGGSASRPDDQRFPRSRRLTSRRQFLAVYAEGARSSCPSFTLFARRTDRDGCRLGLTVTRKFGDAARRNRAKRVLREIFRRNRARLEPACDLVINVHSSFLDHSTADLERQFLRCFACIARRQAR